MPKRESISLHKSLAYIGAWILAIALLVVIMVLIRGNTMDMMTIIGLFRARADVEKWRYARLTWGWIKATVDRVLLFLMAIAGISLTIVFEHYFRKGMHEGLLRNRIIKVLSIEVIVGLLCWLISIGLTALILRIPA
jgi:hypothetical protein